MLNQKDVQSTGEPHYKVKFAFKPYKLQREIIDHLDGVKTNSEGNPFRFLVAVLGRQSGKSWLARYTLLDRAINRKQNCMWVAPAISSARTHWNKLVALIIKSGIPTKKISQSSKEIHFYGGGTISIRSAIEPDNLRGDSLDYIVLDEAAFFRDGEYVWSQVVMPMITATKGTVLFTTTPNGRNWFYDVFRRGQDPNNNYYKSWQIPSTDSPYQDLELLEEIRTSMPSHVWQAEYEAKFLADGGGVFSGVEEASTVNFMLSEPIAGHQYVIGIDFGWSNDYTCITVIDKNERRQVFGVRFTNIGTIPTVKKIIEIMDWWQPEITFVEKNGVGEALFGLIQEVLKGNEADIIDVINDRLDEDEDGITLTDIVGGHKMRAVHTNNDIKRRMIERLAADIEYARLWLLSEDLSYGDTQISEMSTYERKRTPTGMATYGAVEGAHDDTIMALALAYMGIPKPRRAKRKKKKKGSHSSPFRNGSNLHRRKHRA